MLRVTAFSTGKEARKPNSAQSDQETTGKLGSPFLEQCYTCGFAVYKAIRMQDLLTNQWDPNPNSFLIISPFLVGPVPLSFLWMNPVPIAFLWMMPPHPRGLGVISDSLPFLLPHIQLQILSFQPLHRLHFPKMVNSNISRPTCTSRILPLPVKRWRLFSLLELVTVLITRMYRKWWDVTSKVTP